MKETTTSPTLFTPQQQSNLSRLVTLSAAFIYLTRYIHSKGGTDRKEITGVEFAKYLVADWVKKEIEKAKVSDQEHLLAVLITAFNANSKIEYDEKGKDVFISTLARIAQIYSEDKLLAITETYKENHQFQNKEEETEETEYSKKSYPNPEIVQPLITNTRLNNMMPDKLKIKSQLSQILCDLYKTVFDGKPPFNLEREYEMNKIMPQQ